MVSFRPFLALGALLAVVAPINAVTVRISPLGDSLTGGPGCWRSLLWQQLQAAGVTNTDFVGTQPAGGCAIAFDGEHEGHGGFKATGIVTDNQLPGWLAISQPDMVMMMLGTNDVWSNVPTATIIAALSTLIDQMRASKPTMRVLVAKIPPMFPGGCAACNWTAQAQALGEAIAVWAPTKSTAASVVTVVDCFSGFVPADFSDGVHPTSSGTDKLAACWFGPVKDAILGFGGGSATTSSRVSSTTTSVRTSSTTSSTTSVKPSTTSSTTSVVPTTTSSRISTTLSTTTTRSSTTVSTTSKTTTASSTSASSGGAGSPLYGQCGGNGWAGPFTCAVGTCHSYGEWYSQCIPS